MNFCIFEGLLIFTQHYCSRIHQIQTLLQPYPDCIQLTTDDTHVCATQVFQNILNYKVCKIVYNLQQIADPHLTLCFNINPCALRDSNDRMTELMKWKHAECKKQIQQISCTGAENQANYKQQNTHQKCTEKRKSTTTNQLAKSTSCSHHTSPFNNDCIIGWSRSVCENFKMYIDTLHKPNFVPLYIGESHAKNWTNWHNFRGH